MTRGRLRIIMYVSADDTFTKLVVLKITVVVAFFYKKKGRQQNTYDIKDREIKGLALMFH